MPNWTLERIHARYLEGKGQGAGANYVPWLTARDVPSKGVTTRLPGRVTGRQHHCFSNLETSTILVIQRLDGVSDIREQFPLWPLEETVTIADSIGVRHPTPPGHKSFVMTTDIVVSRLGKMEAIAVKPESALRERRTLEKLEIERLYWEHRGVSWSIVTEKELSPALIWNLNWIDEYHDIMPEMLSPAAITCVGAQLLERLTKAPQTPLSKVCLESDRVLGHPEGTALIVVRHLLARKRWSLPMDRKIDPGQPLSEMPVTAVALHNAAA